MLAFMPVDTMSLSVLPSHAPVSQSNGPARRPKLSLNTSSLPSTFGKSSTGLRLDTPSISSPTARNTFSNAYGPEHVQSPDVMTPQEHQRPPQPRLSRLSLNTAVTPTHQQPTRSSSYDSTTSATSATSASSATSVSTDSSISSASTIDSYDKPLPYRLPFNHRSILTNGPHGCLRRNNPFSNTRPLFPATKKVSFRAPLTEDIHNEIYTVSYYDLELSSSSVSTLELPPSEHGQYLKQQAQDEQDAMAYSSSREPNCGDKRDSSSEDESDSDMCPATPVTRRGKRPREWVWTLGPINNAAISESPQKTFTSVDVVMSSPVDENIHL